MNQEFKVKPSAEILEEYEKHRWQRLFKKLFRDWRIYVLLMPMIIFLFFFRYMPIAGILQAFKFTKSISQATPTMDMSWEGFFYLKQILFGSQATEFWKAFRNTFMISMYGLIFGFPIPIIIALFFSEIKNEGYRSVLQVCSYLPHFISTVVVVAIVLQLCKSSSSSDMANGVIQDLLTKIGLVKDGEQLMASYKYFRSIFIISGIWQGSGYGSIVYFASIMAISPTNYQAAKIDGASKLQQIRYVTFPGMAPTLTIMLVLRIGNVLSVGYEKILLMNGNTSPEVKHVISTYVLKLNDEGNTSLAVAGDMFNAVIAMCLVLGANFISRRVSDTALF